MRIAVLMNLASPWSHMICRELSAQGIEVEIFYADSKEQSTYISNSGSDVREFRKQFKSIHCLWTPNLGLIDYFFAGLQLKKFCKKKKYDLIFCLYGGGLAAVACFSGFSPYVIYLVGSDVLLSGGIRNWINRLTYSRATKTYINGQNLYREALRKFRLPRAELRNLGIDLTDFNFKSKTKDIDIICTRGFLPIYNNEYLIEALQFVNPNSYSKIVFAAGGKDLGLAKIKAKALLSPVTLSKIEFIGGSAHDKIIELLSRSKIYVSLSKSDGASISLMEAMASGVCPVLSDIQANSYWVSDKKKNGILVPFDNPKTLASSLEIALKNKRARDKAVAINKKIAESEFDLKKNIAKIVRDIHQMTNTPDDPKA